MYILQIINQIADLIITIREAKHEKYNRNGDDLILVFSMTLIDALNSVPISFVTLDNRRLNITIDEIIR